LTFALYCICTNIYFNRISIYSTAQYLLPDKELKTAKYYDEFHGVAGKGRKEKHRKGKCRKNYQKGKYRKVKCRKAGHRNIKWCERKISKGKCRI
jgi:hypothetical protein